MPSASGDTLVVQIKGLFIRELQWLTTMKQELRPLTSMIDAAAHTELVQLMERYSVESGFFVQENASLRAQWEKADTISEKDRAEVDELSQKVKELAAQLAEVHSLAALITQKRAQTLEHNLILLQKGKENTHKYRLNDIPDSPYIDRKV